jgi:hypothetical protein
MNTLTRSLAVLALVACSEIAESRALSKEEYLATIKGPNQKQDVQRYDSGFVWPYVDKVPLKDYAGFDICWRYVPFVYKTADGAYDHVFVSTRTQNVFLLVLRNNRSGEIFGHHLLNLNEEYGIKNPKRITRSCAR